MADTIKEETVNNILLGLVHLDQDLVCACNENHFLLSGRLGHIPTNLCLQLRNGRASLVINGCFIYKDGV